MVIDNTILFRWEQQSIAGEVLAQNMKGGKGNMAESKLLPPEKRTVDVAVRQGGALVLEAKFYESGGWHEVVPFPFADFAPTLTFTDLQIKNRIRV